MPANTSTQPLNGEPVSTVEVTPKFVTAKDAAAILSRTLGVEVSPWTIHRLCRTGAIDSKMWNGRRVVRISSLDEYAESLPDGRAEVAS